MSYLLLKKKHFLLQTQSGSAPVPTPYDYYYVSLGDSIAAGHAINANWENHYGTRSQYGENGNISTVIVPNSYTDLISKHLKSQYGSDRVQTKSFAHSGDTVAHLMQKLDREAVKNAIASANLVTVCIGANDVLQPALLQIKEYIETGSLANAEATIATNLANLRNDANPDSLTSLFGKLFSINPTAKFIFTTIYNPFKYLWLDTGGDGFFEPLFDCIEDHTTNGFASLIQNGLLNTPYFQKLFSRVNGLNRWAEDRVCELNAALTEKVNAYRAQNPHFCIVDSKAEFDTFSDRNVPAEIHYNDLVNVQFTTGFKSNDLDWAILWRSQGTTAADYWAELAAKHTYWHWDIANPVDFELDDYGVDLGGQIKELLIAPNVDPHPREKGHEALYTVFMQAINN